MTLAATSRATASGRGRRLPFSVVASAAVIVMMAFFALFGTTVAPDDPQRLDLMSAAEPPSAAHLLGTDQLGRDVLSRAIAGARTPLVGALAIALGVAVLGSLLGIPAGYFGGLLDTLMMRWVDLMISFPSLLAAIVLASLLGTSPALSVCILILFATPYEVRMMRGLALEQRNLPYVEAARTAGLPAPRIMARHVWPNTIAILVTDAFLNFALGLVGLTTLSFLGLGLPLGTPDWGRMIFESREIIYDNPLAAVAPALLVSLTAASAAILGDACFERFSSKGRAG